MKANIKLRNKKYYFSAISTNMYTYSTPDFYDAYLQLKSQLETANPNYRVYLKGGEIFIRRAGKDIKVNYQLIYL